MTFSIIIPVYNRPDEVEELLASLCSQQGDFEVIIVEDGSTERCEGVVQKYADKLRIRYFFKDNSGPGQSRNYGAERAEGAYFVFLDSDCVVPDGWLEAIEKALPADAWGGPDRAAADFSDMQKAISYAMTSPLTTGGIRGGKKSIDKFHPRSFNMGVRRDIFLETGGFGDMRFGEDIDLSYRILEAGFTTRLVSDAWVWHKRRTRWQSFFKQVFNSGGARVELSRRHKGTLKLVHLLPAAFTLGLLVAPPLYPLWAAVIFADAWRREGSARVAAMSVWASFIQLTGYGLGFLRGLFTKRTAFEKNFYK